MQKGSCLDNQNSNEAFADWERLEWCRTAVFRGHAPTSRAATTTVLEAPRTALPMVPGQSTVSFGNSPVLNLLPLHFIRILLTEKTLDIVAAVIAGSIAGAVHQTIRPSTWSGQLEIASPCCRRAICTLKFGTDPTSAFTFRQARAIDDYIVLNQATICEIFHELVHD